MNAEPRPTLTAVMLAWGDQPLLEKAVTAVLTSDDVDVDVVLVDNGSTTDAVEHLRRHAGVTVLEPGSNTGFAGGCNLGARAATSEYLAFVNGDVIVDRQALGRMVRALTGDVALTTASVRLDDQPDVVNSAGNPVHFSGLSWAGGLGEPASRHARTCDVASASGAATVVRTDRYAELGGFCEPMFAYCEDTELSLRCWQRGWRVVYVHDAVVRHSYEFSRNDQKIYLLERNRLFVLLTLYEARTLVVLAPALIVLELVILLVAVRQGWWRKKLAGWAWLWHHRTVVMARRAEVQSARRRSDWYLSRVLTGDFSPGPGPGIAAPTVARGASRAYWAVARRLLGRPRAARAASPAVPVVSKTGGARVPDEPAPRADGGDTAGEAYAERLRSYSGARWKRLLDVQRPYRWNLRRLELGRVLDVGCGVGRNLQALAPGSVGVDHNEVAVSMAREAGLSAYTTKEFDTSGLDQPGAFDAILLAHVLEHVSAEVADEILDRYLTCLRDGGRVVLITPQEVGYRSDPTHVRFVDLQTLRSHAARHGLTVERTYSFPFPRPVGKVFKYNEFVLVASKSSST